MHFSGKILSRVISDSQATHLAVLRTARLALFLLHLATNSNLGTINFLLMMTLSENSLKSVTDKISESFSATRFKTWLECNTMAFHPILLAATG
ncbi:hypothetical protein NPIL_356191 [Nephila pilipes]|uniref:Uncharacterized protein n=1 Tax=Nephila pilipes TaxID=299642 RepID=A0A8X6UN13_NEPPI|nr:hypothetical protein NPIL_356191 [Nephila pilipes]